MSQKSEKTTRDRETLKEKLNRVELMFSNDIAHLKLGQAEISGEMKWITRLLVGICLTILGTAITIIMKGLGG